MTDQPKETREGGDAGDQCQEQERLTQLAQISERMKIMYENFIANEIAKFLDNTNYQSPREEMLWSATPLTQKRSLQFTAAPQRRFQAQVV